MYALLRSLSLNQLLIQQIPVLIVCILIAEAFYKFRSFTLECIAFLITWYVIDAVVSFLVKRFLPGQKQPVSG